MFPAIGTNVGKSWSCTKIRVGLVNFKAYWNSKGVQHGSNKTNGLARRSREWTRAALSWKSQWIRQISSAEELSDSHRGAVANDCNHFSILASNPKGLIKRCRSQDNASTEFLIRSLSPTRVLDMKYKIIWASCLLVSIPKRFVSITFGHLRLVRRGLDIHCWSFVLQKWILSIPQKKPGCCQYSLP